MPALGVPGESDRYPNAPFRRPSSRNAFERDRCARLTRGEVQRPSPLSIAGVDSDTGGKACRELARMGAVKHRHTVQGATQP